MTFSSFFCPWCEKCVCVSFMCVCIFYLSVTIVVPPPPVHPLAFRSRAFLTPVACRQQGAVELAPVWLSLLVHVYVPGADTYVISRCFAGVRNPILHSSPGSLSVPYPHSAAAWSEVITGPLWLNTRDIK